METLLLHILRKAFICGQHKTHHAINKSGLNGNHICARCPAKRDDLPTLLSVHYVRNGSDSVFLFLSCYFPQRSSQQTENFVCSISNGVKLYNSARTFFEGKLRLIAPAVGGTAEPKPDARTCPVASRRLCYGARTWTRTPVLE